MARYGVLLAAESAPPRPKIPIPTGYVELIHAAPPAKAVIRNQRIETRFKIKSVAINYTKDIQPPPPPPHFSHKSAWVPLSFLAPSSRTAHFTIPFSFSSWCIDQKARVEVLQLLCLISGTDLPLSGDRNGESSVMP